jgi:hypothetical protein
MNIFEWLFGPPRSKGGHNDPALARGNRPPPPKGQGIPWQKEK